MKRACTSSGSASSVPEPGTSTPRCRCFETCSGSTTCIRRPAGRSSSFRPGRGDFVEVVGNEHSNSKVFPAEVREGTVIAFAVDDIVGAREELAATEVELIGDLVWANELFDTPSMEGFGWFFFRAPDRNVYVMQQDRRPDSA